MPISNFPKIACKFSQIHLNKSSQNHDCTPEFFRSFIIRYVPNKPDQQSGEMEKFHQHDPGPDRFSHPGIVKCGDMSDFFHFIPHSRTL